MAPNSTLLDLRVHGRGKRRSSFRDVTRFIQKRALVHRKFTKPSLPVTRLAYIPHSLSPTPIQPVFSMLNENNDSSQYAFEHSQISYQVSLSQHIPSTSNHLTYPTHS